MEELIALIEQLNLTLKQQINLLNEFILILNQEEQSISTYCFLEVEKSIILKDNHSKIMLSLEEKRINILKKICYMIAFDSRGQKLTLPLFKTVFGAYLNNVKNLLTKDVFIKIEELNNNFLEITNEFSLTFENASKRIYRNQIILKKVLKHVNLSLNLFQSEAVSSMNYDSLGKSQSAFNQQNPVSSIRVTV